MQEARTSKSFDKMAAFKFPSGPCVLAQCRKRFHGSGDDDIAMDTKDTKRVARSTARPDNGVLIVAPTSCSTESSSKDLDTWTFNVCKTVDKTRTNANPRWSAKSSTVSGSLKLGGGVKHHSLSELILLFQTLAI